MHRITKRTWLMSIFLVILLGGMGVFLFDYYTRAGEWIMAQGSPHVYNSGNLGCGIVTDRSGNELLDLSGQRKYSENQLTRTSTMHWLGDRQGFISAGAIANYAGMIAGFDLVNGVYDSTGTGGVAVLTLSEKVQNAAYAALSGRRGTISVYNYKTGEILCAVTAPTYDPDNVPEVEGNENYEGVYLNRFLQSAYPPGSIYKVVTTAAALECVPGILERTFTCTGKYKYSNDATEAVTCESAHGNQNLKAALANSCNCAFAQVAELVGRKNMTKYVDQFHVTEPIRFDGVKSVAGKYDNSDTGGISFAWSVIGQHTDLVNPARFLTFMGTIANGGKGVEPYLVKEIISGEETVYEASPRSTDRIMSAETAATVQQFMRNNVVNIYGAGNFPGLTVCAKSGTSQLGGGKISNAMFAGYCLDDAYPLAFMAVVENSGYGAYNCVPILSVVLQECKNVMDAE